MTSDAKLQPVIEAVLEALQKGSFVPGPLAGTLSLHEGLQAQLGVLERLRARGETLGGWKAGMTSGAGRDSMGPGFRPFGFVLQSRIHRSGDTLSLAPIGRAGVEAELCFRIGKRPASARPSPDEIRDCVAAFAPAFEINQMRMREDDGGLRCAENLSQWGIVVGPERPIPPDFDFDALEVELHRDGVKVGSAVGRGWMDPHFLSLSRVADLLADFGLSLEPGQHIITGAFVRENVRGPAHWRGTFSGIGSVEIRLA